MPPDLLTLFVVCAAEVFVPIDRIPRSGGDLAQGCRLLVNTTMKPGHKARKHAQVAHGHPDESNASMQPSLTGRLCTGDEAGTMLVGLVGVPGLHTCRNRAYLRPVPRAKRLVMIRRHTILASRTSLRVDSSRVFMEVFDEDAVPRRPRHGPSADARRAPSNTPRLLRHDELSQTTDRRK